MHRSGRSSPAIWLRGSTRWTPARASPSPLRPGRLSVARRRCRRRPRAAPATRGVTPFLPGVLAGGLALLAAALASGVIRRTGREYVPAVGVPVTASPGGRPRIDLAELAGYVVASPSLPAGLAPAEGGVLVAGRVLDQHKAAWLVGQAVDGVVDLAPDGTHADEITMVRLQSGDEVAARLLDIAFRGRDRLTLGVFDRDFARMWGALGRQLADWQRESGLWDADADRRARWVRIVGTLVGVAGVVLAVVGGYLSARQADIPPVIAGLGGALAGTGTAAAVRGWELRVFTPEGSAACRSSRPSAWRSADDRRLGPSAPDRESGRPLSLPDLEEQRGRMRRTHQRPARPETVVELRGGVADDLVDYARRKVAGVLAHTGRPVLHSRVRVTRHGDPARERPVVAQANVDLDGRPGARAGRGHHPARGRRSPRRPARPPPRAGRRGAGRRGAGAMFEDEPHEWRHDFPPTPRRSYYPARRPSAASCGTRPSAPLPCTVDEAVAEMDDLDHDFHLFVEVGRGIDSLVYRAGPTGVRLAQVDGRADEVVPGRHAGDGEHRVPRRCSTRPRPSTGCGSPGCRSCSTSTATTAGAACSTTATTATTA